MTDEVKAVRVQVPGGLKAFARKLMRDKTGIDPTPTQCCACGKEVNTATEFRDPVSKVEWGITQTCQACQDKFFADPEEEVSPEGTGCEGPKG